MVFSFRLSERRQPDIFPMETILEKYLKSPLIWQEQIPYIRQAIPRLHQLFLLIA
jgi:hypothetical protein